MSTRRDFLTVTIRGFFAAIIFPLPFFPFLQRAWGKAKRLILPEGTRMETLKNRNPAELDTRNLRVIPLEEFGVMGLTEHEVDLDTWRLRIEGIDRGSVELKYRELTSLPSLEREVLLICPGFFANYGRWKGVSIRHWIKAAHGFTHVTFRGPEGPYEKVNRFPIADVLSDKVFLAFAVNGRTLPEKHGFPLRVVAEGYYGYDWTKYVYRITFERIASKVRGLGGCMGTG